MTACRPMKVFHVSFDLRCHSKTPVADVGLPVWSCSARWYYIVTGRFAPPVSSPFNVFNVSCLFTVKPCTGAKTGGGGGELMKERNFHKSRCCVWADRSVDGLTLSWGCSFVPFDVENLSQCLLNVIGGQYTQRTTHMLRHVGSPLP